MTGKKTGTCPGCGREGPIEEGCPSCPGFWFDGRKRDMPADVRLGDFIEIPEWGAVGCVMSISYAMMGSEDAREVLLQEDPDQPRERWKNYRIEPGEFWNLEGQDNPDGAEASIDAQEAQYWETHEVRYDDEDKPYIAGTA